jgi:IS30 family transposase
MKNNASVVGTLIERFSSYLMLVRMNDATATSAVEGFSAALNGMPLPLVKTCHSADRSVNDAES